MPPSIDQLAMAQPTELIVVFDKKTAHPWKSKNPGESPPPDAVTLTYIPTYRNKRYMKEADKITAEGRASLIYQFLEAVKSWDLRGSDKKPIPLTEEALEPVPFMVMSAILLAIDEDLMAPKSGD